jgi:hypothetical protein
LNTCFLLPHIIAEAQDLEFLPQSIQLLSQSIDTEYFLEKFLSRREKILVLSEESPSQSEDTAQILYSVLTSTEDFVKIFNKIPIQREEFLSPG